MNLCRLPLNVVVVIVLMLATTAYLRADQIPAPALTTDPSPPPAGQPFNATFFFYGNPSAFGVNESWTNQSIQVRDNRITVPFALDCGFICPGGPVYNAYPLTLPALPAGTYQVQFVDAANNSNLLAEFVLAVGVASIPVLSPSGSTLLAFLFLTLAFVFQREINK